jgi:hypothetical protein
MRSRDVVALFDRVGTGARVDIFRESLAQRLPKLVPASAATAPATADSATPAPALLAGEKPDEPREL